MTLSAESTPTKDGYVLNRGFAAAARLNCQHYIWRQELGYNLHPSIVISAQSRIADVATGTGAWLLEVAREYPIVQCDGFDISLIQAPPSTWLPSNVSLRGWDFNHPPPAELVNTYDVVHVRLVLLVVQNEGFISVLRNLVNLLKPGGWLQWDELDPRDSVVAHAAGPSGKTKAMQKMDRKMKSFEETGWVLKMPEMMMEDGGFDEAQLHRVKANWSYLKFYTDMCLLVWAEYASNLPVESEQRKEFEQLVEGVLEEAKQGAAYGVAKVIIVGRKGA